MGDPLSNQYMPYVKNCRFFTLLFDSNFDLSGMFATTRAKLIKVFPSLFSKSDRPSNARSVGRASQGAKQIHGVFFFAKLFSLRLWYQRKKRIMSLDGLNVEKTFLHKAIFNRFPLFF